MFLYFATYPQNQNQNTRVERQLMNKSPKIKPNKSHNKKQAIHVHFLNGMYMETTRPRLKYSNKKHVVYSRKLHS